MRVGDRAVEVNIITGRWRVVENGNKIRILKYSQPASLPSLAVFLMGWNLRWLLRILGFPKGIILRHC